MLPLQVQTSLVYFRPKQLKPLHELPSFRLISLLEVPWKFLKRLITHIQNTLKTTYTIGNTAFARTDGLGVQSPMLVRRLRCLTNKHQTNIILQDITQVWHHGLKYKITLLPPHFTRPLCNFLDDRTANIHLGSHLGPPIQQLNHMRRRYYTNHLTSPNTHKKTPTPTAINTINTYNNKWKIQTNAQIHNHTSGKT